MNRFRIALILAAGGFALKSAGVVVYRLFHPPVVAKVLTTFDPLGVRFANSVLPLFFDLRGIAPSPGAPVVYEALLVFAFTVECFVLGVAFSEARRLLRRGIDPPPDAPPVVG
jgi:hypothetical protein